MTSSDVDLYLYKYDTGSRSAAPADAESREGTAASGAPDVLIEGVLHGDTTGVMVSNNVTPDDLTLTVWKVDLNKSDNVVEIEESGAAADDAADEKREAIEKSIQYIIKIEQPKEGATLSATGKGGAALTKSHGYAAGWYGFGDDGYMLRDWQCINGYWYYFDPANGLMMIGWQNINGKDYYFNPGVIMAGSLVVPVSVLFTNTTTPDGYKVDDNGARI